MDTKKMINFFLKERRGDMIIIFLAFATGLYLEFGILEILIFLIFIWMILHPFSSRFPASIAMILLVLTALVLIFLDKGQAEKLAIYAYYFLLMAVIMGFYELKKEERDISGINDENLLIRKQKSN